LRGLFLVALPSCRSRRIGEAAVVGVVDDDVRFVLATANDDINVNFALFLLIESANLTVFLLFTFLCYQFYRLCMFTVYYLRFSSVAWFFTTAHRVKTDISSRRPMFPLELRSETFPPALRQG